VHAFSSDISEKGKKAAWAKFQSGEYRTLCATDAAGMGCNVPDIKFVVSFGVPKSKSLSTVAQRWGWGGRDRKTQATCLLLVPKWTFRPSPAVTLTQQHLERGRKAKKSQESKKDMLRRANLDERLENFINIGSPGLPSKYYILQICPHHLIIILDCAHLFLRKEFSPKTGLAIRRSLEDNGPLVHGFRSKGVSFELSWTILNLQRTPPADRCCYQCHPQLLAPFAPADKHDARLITYSHHFLYGLAPPNSRPSSSASIRSEISMASSFTASRTAVKVPKEEQEKLHQKLILWRVEKHRQRGSPLFLSAQIFLPPKQLNAFVMHSPKFLQEQDLTTRLIRKLVPWDSATESDLEGILSIINDWCETASIVIPTTPASQRRARKKTRVDKSNNPGMIPQPALPIVQPTFATSRFRLPPPHPRPIQPTSAHANDENVFQTPSLTPQPPTPNYSPLPVQFYQPGPTSYITAVSSPVTPSSALHNPYQHLVGSARVPPPYYSPYTSSPYTSSGLSWTPAPAAHHSVPPVQYQFAHNYIPSNHPPQPHK